MVGPNPGAGIKLLVHENNEVPLVRDLGVAIPPGTHAYVGVKIFEVNPATWRHGLPLDFLNINQTVIYTSAPSPASLSFSYLKVMSSEVNSTVCSTALSG